MFVERIIVHSILVETRCDNQNCISTSVWHPASHLHCVTCRYKRITTTTCSVLTIVISLSRVHLPALYNGTCVCIQTVVSERQTATYQANRHIAILTLASSSSNDEFVICSQFSNTSHHLHSFFNSQVREFAVWTAHYKALQSHSTVAFSTEIN